MTIRTFVNIKSVRKYQKDGSYCAQLIAADENGNHTFYACRLSGSNMLDTSEAYQYVNNSWQLVTIDSALAKSLESTLKKLVSVTGSAYKRKHESADGDISFSMYVDTVLYVSTNSGHAIKIDDKLFYTASPRDLLPATGYTTTIRYMLLSDPTVSGVIDLAEDANLKRRLENQFDAAYEKYMKIKNREPIGGGSWAGTQDDRQRFGKSRFNHRQLDRNRQLGSNK